VYHFHNDGKEELYSGSADLMVRNLDRRVEILFPIENRSLVARLREDILGTYLGDTRNSFLMHSDGSYVHQDCSQTKLNSHTHFLGRDQWN
ncbi:MAG: RNA degradosome polyphosphate kinase, partial [Acidobacteriota bacterium]